jgi:uncharacterized membrane protein
MHISVTPIWVILLATGISLHFVPLYTRPDLYFGVTVSPAFRRTGPARLLLRNYRVALWCLTVGALAAAGAFERAPVVLGVYLASVCATLVIAHRGAEKHRVDPVTSIEVDLAAPTERLPGGLLAVLLPFILLLGVGVWSVSYAVVAAPGAVIMRMVSIGLSCLVLTAIAFGVLHWSRRISASGPDAAGERSFRHRILLCLIACEYFLVLLAALSVLEAPRFVIAGSRAAFGVAMVAYVVTLIRAGQGGTRLSSAPHETVIGDRSPDNCWKGGLFYFNHRDRAIFVEKRMGIGYTLNFGSLWAWLLLGAIFAIPSGLHLMQPITTGARLNAAAAASPGTEASLRRYIDSLEGGHPNYDEMSPMLAAAVNRQLPTIMSTIRKLGEFKSLTYEGVDPNGSDVYDAMFVRGQLEWHIAPLSVDGKVTSRSFRPLR